MKENKKENKVEEKKKFEESDFEKIATMVCDELSDRKKKRADLEKQWKEVDRQLRMEPDVTYKMGANNQKDPNKRWMPEMELPYQAQALEMLVADSRRLKFPDQGAWFTSHAERTQEYIDRVAVDPPFFMTAEEMATLGKEKMVVDQDSANELVTSWMMFLHDQYDFKRNCDIIDAEAFKYGTAFPRARIVKKRTFSMSEKGVVSNIAKIPMLVPLSTWDVYADDRIFHLNNEGEEISPAIIQCKKQSYDDLIIASRGSKDPKDENGGWLPDRLEKLERPEKGVLEVVEYEGDLLIPKSQGSLYIPNAIVTVAIGEKKKEVIRARFNQFEACSYVPHFYHQEDPHCAYGTSPLMKGMPIQKAAVDALNRTIMTAAYQAQPAVQYDGDDPAFAANGGPVLYPGASIASTGDITTIKMGDVGALSAAYFALVGQYESLTGTQAPRMGAQTSSHTTAYAKQQELARGTVRTVDYVRSVNNGPMYKWLQLCYTASKKVMGNKEYGVFNYASKTFIERLGKDHLPDNVHFEVYGANNPSVEASQSGAEVNALQGALNIEMIAKQMGLETGLDIVELQKRMLEKGQVTDVAELYVARNQGVSEGAEAGPAMGGADQFNPGAAGLFLQNLAISGRR